MDKPGIGILLTAIMFLATNSVSAQLIDTLNYGDNTTNFLPQGGLHAYRFWGDEGDRIVVRLCDETAGLDGYIEMVKPNSELMYEGSGNTYELRIDTTLMESGYYTLRVSDEGGNESGAYGLAIQKVNFGQGTELMGSHMNLLDTVEGIGYIKTYLIQGNEGDRIMMRMCDPGAGLDNQMELYAPDGHRIGYKIGGTYEARIDVSLDENGIYTLLLMDSQGQDTGGFGFSLHKVFSQEGVLELDLNSSFQDSIKALAYSNIYRFHGEAGTKIMVRMCDETSGLDNQLELYTPNGLRIFQATESSFSELIIDTITLSETGTYICLAMDEDGENLGFYGFQLQQISPPPNRPIIREFETAQDSVSNLAEVRPFLFCGRAEEAPVIRMTEIDFALQPQIRLYDPDGFFLAHVSNSSQATLETTLNKDGIFTVLAMDKLGINSGQFSINLVGSGNCTARLIDTTLCADESIVVNGNTYNIDNPSGTEAIGDTVVVVQLSFFSPSEYHIDTTLCIGMNIEVNGTVYSESTPNGMEILPNMSINGCDSIVHIDLNYIDAVEFFLDSVLCSDGSIEVNGTVYDYNNPLGSELFPNGSQSGCDSIVNINLSFFPEASFNLDQSLCRGQNLIVNGAIYDEANSSGTEILPNASVNGCDSIINVELTFSDTITQNLSQQLCDGAFILINGNRYDKDTPTGFEFIPNGATGGCDSLIIVSLSFYPKAEFYLEETLCSGETKLAGNTVYDENNPSGTEVLSNASINGCDSIIHVNLRFYPEARYTISESFCEGESVFVNGALYNVHNPNGVEVLPGISANGCDSIVVISLSFVPTALDTLSLTLCRDSSISINGAIYDQDRPSGIERFWNGAYNGCDSILYVDLQFDSVCIASENLYIPEGITPDGNGLNDFFVIPLLNEPGRLPFTKLIIKNRWGAVVFESSPYQNDWGGTDKNGNPLPAGTYFYYFQFGDEIHKLGMITIIR